MRRAWLGVAGGLGVCAVLMAGCGVSPAIHARTVDELEACRLARVEDAETMAQLRQAQPSQAPPKRRPEARQRLMERLREELGSLLRAGRLTLEVRRGMIVVRLPQQALFEPGEAEVGEAGQRVVVRVAKALRGLDQRRVLVAGHTDGTPVREGSPVGSNWALSSARALAVLTLLVDAGVAPTRLGLAGFGEHDPVASNATEEGRALNRRIELIVMPELEEVLGER